MDTSTSHGVRPPLWPVFLVIAVVATARIGVGIARQWIDRDGVDLIVDVPTSSVALAVNNVIREKNRAYINTGAATGDLTGVQCTPSTIHWAYDTYMLARSTGGKGGGNMREMPLPPWWRG